MPKNIVIFSDGTGQEGGNGPSTNIYKLFNMVEDRTSDQVSFYDRGLGTGWRKLSGNVGGSGISDNIIECYTFIFENFEAGDDIFLFGFSRGAATVRSLSSFIHYFGILPKSRPELIEKAYDIYKIENESKRVAAAAEFVKRHHTIWTKVKLIGCFDTVAALGLPIKSISVMTNKLPGFKNKFQNFTLSKSIVNAYQALAIDDERETFHPLLWDAEAEPDQTIRQVWFCGMHTDVGGGYPGSDLSDIPLKWMRDKALKHGLRLYQRQRITINGNPNGTMHDSRGKGWTKLYQQKPRYWDTSRTDQPIVHRSVLERRLNVQNKDSSAYEPWILNSDLDYQIEE